ncbi:hypothetical protein LTR53_008472 [Teratosphaeriaceae sp. CCFEE 6253]|nr:hypothetical protein LTR53_008472 [Teratosphaeriaceae sp. CCFEE 6253]
MFTHVRMWVKAIGPEQVALIKHFEVLVLRAERYDWSRDLVFELLRPEEHGLSRDAIRALSFPLRKSFYSPQSDDVDSYLEDGRGRRQTVEVM